MSCKLFIILFGILLTGIAPLPAKTLTELLPEEPRRTFEAGIDGGAYAANNLFRLGDIFNVRRTLLIDLADVPAKRFSAAAGGKARVFFNLNIPGGYGAGLFAGMDAMFYGAAPEALTRLLSRGNADTDSLGGDSSMGGGVFWETGVKGTGKFGRLRLALRPAFFTPLVYIPAAKMDYSFDMTEDSVNAYGLFGLDIYSFYDMEEKDGPLSANAGILPLGFDFSLAAEYALLPMLDLGAFVSHVPILPARMSRKTRAEAKFRLEIDDTFNSITSGNIDVPDPDIKITYDNNANFSVLRPFRFDLYAKYRPEDGGFFVIRPNAGFSLTDIYEDIFCFNAGLEGQLNILDIFSLAIFAGYTERLWVYNFHVMLNLHITEIVLDISLPGTDMIDALSVRGFGLSLGLRFGY
jgi:hypothetical protein